MASGKTSQYYKKNPEARKRRLKQQAKYNKTKKGLKIRTAANKCNRKMGTYGNGDGLDNSHKANGKTVKEKASSNRRRNGNNGSSKYKR